MNKLKILVCIHLVLVTFQLNGQDALNQAYELGQKGLYDQAASIYADQIRLHGPSADLYFNLGTALLNSNQIAGARIALEKAIRLEPGNKPVQKQLEVLKQKIEPQIEAQPDILPYQWFIRLRNVWTPRGWGLAFFLLIYLTALWILLYRAGRAGRIPFRMFYPMLAIVALTGLLYCSGIRNQNENFYVLINDHPLHVAPDSSSQVLIPLGEGSKADVLDSLGLWYKVLLENNDQGWLPKNKLRNN